jgi:hypothetical protein
MAYTTINKSSLNFNTKLYTGNGGNQTITGVGFTPDFVWFKSRDANNSNALVDIVRGTNKVIYSDNNSSQQPIASQTFNSDGFALVNDGGANSMNSSGSTKVAWSWKANGAGSANTGGTINSTVSVNTTAGFSIVKWSGTSATGTVGHGLGSVPKTVWVKSLGNAEGMYTYWQPLGNNKQLLMSSTSAQGTTTLWNNTTPTSSVFSVTNHSAVNGSGDYIAYCFAEKTGYSKFGSYVGNGNADGAFVYTGFKPAFVIQKSTSTAVDWQLHDNKRGQYFPGNVVNNRIQPNQSSAESTGDDIGYDFLSNGFKTRTSNAAYNGSGLKFIYMAFAEAPLVGSNNVPCTAR